MAHEGPDAILAKAVESSQNVKFGKGVVSKTTYVAALVIATWIVIAWRWSADLMADGGLLIAGLAATAFGAWYIKSSQNFAERNPAQAMLDGAEFLEWSRLEAAAKGIPSLPSGRIQIELQPNNPVENPDV